MNINGFLRLATAGLLLVTIYYQHKEISKLKNEVKIQPVLNDTKIVDSLQDELFNAQTETGRYELSLEHLYEVNPKAGKQFTDFMEHETE